MQYTKDNVTRGKIEPNIRNLCKTQKTQTTGILKLNEFLKVFELVKLHHMFFRDLRFYESPMWLLKGCSHVAKFSPIFFIFYISAIFCLTLCQWWRAEYQAKWVHNPLLTEYRADIKNEKIGLNFVTCEHSFTPWYSSFFPALIFCHVILHHDTSRTWDTKFNFSCRVSKYLMILTKIHKTGNSYKHSCCNNVYSHAVGLLGTK